VLLFEFFPAFIAIVVLVVGIFLFAMNRRAHNNPHEQERPRTPSRPPVSPEAEADASSSNRRPSMRA
jgi:hypothetical protein